MCRTRKSSLNSPTASLVGKTTPVTTQTSPAIFLELSIPSILARFHKRRRKPLPRGGGLIRLGKSRPKRPFSSAVHLAASGNAKFGWMPFFPAPINRKVPESDQTVGPAFLPNWPHVATVPADGAQQGPPACASFGLRGQVLRTYLATQQSCMPTGL